MSRPSLRSLARMLLVIALLVPAPAGARPHRFVGAHPVHARHGGGWCYIEAPHVHGYSPDHAALYDDETEGARFIGDPTPFGYAGPKSVFYGHHPVPIAPPGVYCYLDGPHYHPYAAEGPQFRVEAGTAFYVGPFGATYARERPRRARAFAVEYRPFVAARPVVEVRPPPEWHGEVWTPPPPPSVSATVAVEVPAPPSAQVVVTAPPPPSAHVVVTAPPVPAPHVVVGVAVPPPPLPRPRIVVAAPPPPPPGVVVVQGPGHGHGHGRKVKWKEDRGGGGGYVVKWKGDRGKHRGHYK